MGISVDANLETKFSRVRKLVACVLAMSAVHGADGKLPWETASNK